MSTLYRRTVDILPAQQAIREKCYHPSGTFVEFKEEELEQSIADRFEQIVRMHPDRLVVKTTCAQDAPDTRRPRDDPGHRCDRCARIFK